MEREQLADMLIKGAESRRIEKIVSIEQKPALAVGENYLSDIFRLKVIVQLANGNESKRWFILKKAIADSDSAILKAIKKKIFNKELLMYNKVLRDIGDLMSEFDDTSEKYWCKFYGHDMTDFMLFQDLKASGYSVNDRSVGLSLVDATLVLRTLGKYHAATRVLTDRGKVAPDMFEPYGPLTNEHYIEWFFVKSIRNLCQVMEEDWGPEWKDVKDKLNAPTETLAGKIMEITRLDGSPFNTLLHADCWVNNLMFRHDESGYPVSLKMIDFQVCIYGSPAFDLSYFFSTSLTAEVRNKERENLLKIYYDSLCSSLKFYGYTPDKLPSYEDLQQQMERHRIWALVTLIYYHSFISAENGNYMDILALLQSKGEQGHNIDVFRRVKWREEIGDYLRTLVDQNIELPMANRRLQHNI